MIRSCERRSFDAATIFIALVICCVFFTERIRRRRSMSDGMIQSHRGERWDREIVSLCGLCGLCGYAALAFLDAKSPANSFTAASSAAFN